MVRVAGSPYGLSRGPGGALWFTEWAVARLGRITPEGAITETELAGAEPHGVAAGPDGAIWVAMESGSLERIPL